MLKGAVWAEKLSDIGPNLVLAHTAWRGSLSQLDKSKGLFSISEQLVSEITLDFVYVMCNQGTKVDMRISNAAHKL
jgi:hypothetical protein